MSSFDANALCEFRRGTGVPAHIKAGRTIGKGANNEVVAAVCSNTGLSCIIRRPLRNTDSRLLEDAMREARYTYRASELDAAPRVLDMWYARKTAGSQRRGLHMICERYDCDMVDMLEHNMPFFIRNLREFGRQLLAAIRAMARAGLFSYDIKPSNTVCSFDPPRIRLIDLGADYTIGLDDAEESKLAAFVRERAAAILGDDDPAAVRRATCFAFEMCMLVAYSAHMHDTLRGIDSGIHRNELFRCNLLVPAVCDIQSSAPEAHLVLASELLAHKELRKTFEHYFDVDRKEAHRVAAKRAKFNLRETA